MFTSRNIHFAILGIILGAVSGYIFAFYRAQAAQVPPPLTETEAAGDVPTGHPEVNPDVNNEQMLAAMKKAVEADPTQPEVVKRYAMALFDAGHFEDASTWFGKAVELEPRSVDARSMYGAVLWRIGKKEEAALQLEETLKIDPANIPSLHGLTLLALEKRDTARAGQLIDRIEGIEPTYSQLSELRARLQAERGSK